MDEVNGAQVGGIARWLVGSVMAYLIGKGWIPGGVAADIVALAGVLSMGVWSYYAHKPIALVTQAADTGLVKQIVVNDPAVAIAIPNPKVVA